MDEPKEYPHEIHCNTAHVADENPCPPRGAPEHRSDGPDTDEYQRLGDRNDIIAMAKRLSGNGDKWEESARKSWRREDAANRRWLEAARDLDAAKDKLGLVTAILEFYERNEPLSYQVVLMELRKVLE